ncbi:MAG: chemoreceptor glutamine deamidase CheD [Acidobacteria bacterium]|nr:chemoreceptor glutamine deamidase CheD [Acidobacteriota bacterium]
MAIPFSGPPAPSQAGVSFGFEHIERTALPKNGQIRARVRPGEVYVSQMDEEIMTILGSCIAVCARDPATGVGGLNHFLLPDSNQPGSGFSTRYGIWAMEMLINSLLKHGASRERLEIKVTGGSQIGSTGPTVSSKNISFIDDFLAVEGFIPKARDVGGIHPRKVYYYPLTGRLIVNKLPPLQSAEINMAEIQLSRRLSARSRAGSVELFDSEEE